MEAKLIDKFVEFKGFPSECFDALDWAEYEAFEVGYMRALFEFGDFSGLKREVQKFLTNIPEEENNEYFDVNNRKLKEGDVIDIKQTVNGNNLFRITSLNPLHIVYHESGQDYEYDQEDLLSPSALNGDVEWEIVSDKVEIWKDIIGYEGLYQISSFGRIKSMGRDILNTRGSFNRKIEDKIYEGNVGGPSNNRLYFLLHKDGEHKNVLIHRMVAKHFSPYYEESSKISFRDGDFRNVKLSNLEIV